MNMEQNSEEHIKKDDYYSVVSASELKKQISKMIKSVYVGCLKCVEFKFGKEFDGKKQIRGEILTLGNDCIRDIEKLIDERFNVEFVPEIISIDCKNRKGEV